VTPPPGDARAGRQPLQPAAQGAPPAQRPQYRPPQYATPPPQRPTQPAQPARPPQYAPPIARPAPVVAEEIPEFVPEEDLAAEALEAEERLRRRRRSNVNAVVATVAAIMVALILLAILANKGFIHGPSSFNPTALGPEDLTAPAVPTSAPDRGDPRPGAVMGAVPASYTLIWIPSPVYAGYGGSMRINVTNTDSRAIYVGSVRMVPDWSSQGYACTWGHRIEAGATHPIGLLAFSGPSTPGSYDYHFELDILIEPIAPLLEWRHASNPSTDKMTMEVLPAEAVGSYPVYHNDPAIYRRANDLVRPNDTGVPELADTLSSALGGEYNLYWVAALFDWTRENLAYIPDPTDDDIWSPPSDTLTAGGGDCEEYAILMASVVKHWGGDARFYVITKHAFAGIYLGPPEMDETAVAAAFNMFQGTSARYAWFKDTLGYWVIADGTSSLYLGGLPYNGVATDLQGGWDIKGTEYLYITDIVPGYPK